MCIFTGCGNLYFFVNWGKVWGLNTIAVLECGSLWVRNGTIGLYITWNTFISVMFPLGPTAYFKCCAQHAQTYKAHKACFCLLEVSVVSIPERSGMRIACFNVRMKVVLNVKVSRTIGVGADQDPVETKNKRCQTCSMSMILSCCNSQLWLYTSRLRSLPLSAWLDTNRGKHEHILLFGVNWSFNLYDCNTKTFSNVKLYFKVSIFFKSKMTYCLKRQS